MRASLMGFSEDFVKVFPNYNRHSLSENHLSMLYIANYPISIALFYPLR